jgi:hypothetical protein
MTVKKKHKRKRRAAITPLERFERHISGRRQPEEPMCDEDCSKCQAHGCGG